jgi:hypothetical protein
VNRSDFDRQSAAAESVLDAIDDGPAMVGELDRVELTDGMHIETDPPDLDAEDDADGTHHVVDHAELLDTLAEAFNARDVDAILELCTPDCEIPGLASDMDDLSGAMDDLWERRPTVTMTRATDDTMAVGVVWERAETAAWAPIGTCHVDIDEHGLASVLEFSDDVGLLDTLDLDPPDGDLEEGARWEEWAEGADGDA